MSKIKLDNFENEIERNAKQFVSASRKTQQRINKIISKANEKNKNYAVCLYLSD